MTRRETSLKAPQFGIGGHLKADPGKAVAAEHKESAKDVRDTGTTSANGTPSFWYPRDLDLPATSVSRMAAKPAPKAAEKRQVEVVVRKNGYLPGTVRGDFSRMDCGHYDGSGRDGFTSVPGTHCSILDVGTSRGDSA